MSYRIVTSAAEARAIEQAQDKLLGYPSRGVRAGAGQHVPLAASWDGTGLPPRGWTSYVGSSIQHPTLAQWAVPLDDDTPRAMANGRRSRLTAQEQTKMAADIAAAVVTLPVDWISGATQAQAQAKEEEGGRT